MICLALLQWQREDMVSFQRTEKGGKKKYNAELHMASQEWGDREEYPDPQCSGCPVLGAAARLCWLILTYIMRNCFISCLYKCNSQRRIGNGDLEAKLKTFQLSFRQIDLEQS